MMKFLVLIMLIFSVNVFGALSDTQVKELSDYKRRAFEMLSQVNGRVKSGKTTDGKNCKRIQLLLNNVVSWHFNFNRAGKYEEEKEYVEKNFEKFKADVNKLRRECFKDMDPDYNSRKEKALKDLKESGEKLSTVLDKVKPGVSVLSKEKDFEEIKRKIKLYSEWATRAKAYNPVYSVEKIESFQELVDVASSTLEGYLKRIEEIKSKGPGSGSVAPATKVKSAASGQRVAEKPRAADKSEAKSKPRAKRKPRVKRKPRAKSSSGKVKIGERRKRKTKTPKVKAMEALLKLHNKATKTCSDALKEAKKIRSCSEVKAQLINTGKEVLKLKKVWKANPVKHLKSSEPEYSKIISFCKSKATEVANKCEKTVTQRVVEGLQQVAGQIADGIKSMPQLRKDVLAICGKATQEKIIANETCKQSKISVQGFSSKIIKLKGEGEDLNKLLKESKLACENHLKECALSVDLKACDDISDKAQKDEKACEKMSSIEKRVAETSAGLKRFKGKNLKRELRRFKSVDCLNRRTWYFNACDKRHNIDRGTQLDRSAHRGAIKCCEKFKTGNIKYLKRLLRKEKGIMKQVAALAADLKTIPVATQNVCRGKCVETPVMDARTEDSTGFLRLLNERFVENYKEPSSSDGGAEGYYFNRQKELREKFCRGVRDKEGFLYPKKNSKDIAECIRFNRKVFSSYKGRDLSLLRSELFITGKASLKSKSGEEMTQEEKIKDMNLLTRKLDDFKGFKRCIDVLGVDEDSKISAKDINRFHLFTNFINDLEAKESLKKVMIMAAMDIAGKGQAALPGCAHMVKAINEAFETGNSDVEAANSELIGEYLERFKGCK